MNDPRLEPLLQTAVSRLLASMNQAVDKTGTQLGMLSLAATNSAERQALMDAEYDLQRRGAAVSQAFGRELAEGLAKELQQHTPGGNALADTDWTALRLMDDAEIEQNVSADKLTRLLEVDCDSELSELRGYFATLHGDAGAEDAFPLRPAVIGKCLMRAVNQGSDKPDARLQLAKVLALHTSAALKDCYNHLIKTCQEMRVASAPMAVRRPGNGATTGSPGLDSRADALNSRAGGLSSGHGPLSGSGGFGGMPGGMSGGGQRSVMEDLGQMFCIPCPEPLTLDLPLQSPVTQGLQHTGAAQSGQAQAPGGGGTGSVAAAGSQGEGHGGIYAPGDSGMLGLMRRLQSISSLSPQAFASSSSNEAGALEPQPFNVIRAHREELVRASGGASLDQMVIDIVATLFDQVLSDPKVPPQMARQIARLQLPVLRVALRDQSFFHARKHPVRKLINRMATLATSFEGLDEGPGRECIEVVSTLVNEIVEGDFDRMEVYEAQLQQLEKFISEQTAVEAAESSAVAALLSGKEADLRVQQRYMQMVSKELKDLEVPDFIKTFLAQIWTQVQVMAATRHGMDSDASRRMKRAGHQLVLSVQPKGHPSLRQDFLRQLPQLMKDLSEGMDMIQWPAAAKQAFFGQLLPLHAEALKAPPPHELTLRMLEDRLRKVEQIAIPSRAEAANDPLPGPSEPGALAMASSLSPIEARDAGWVSEAALGEDSSNLDIDLSGSDEADLAGPDVDILLDSPPPPATGPSLVNFIQAGAAYRMLLKGHWRKVRLTWVSEGRTFFIFTHGHQAAKETISLTARTLGQMCASGRFKAFEQAQLLERATIRARRQLAALSTQRKAA